jgi:hypothetical protein
LGRIADGAAAVSAVMRKDLATLHESGMCVKDIGECWEIQSAREH